MKLISILSVVFLCSCNTAAQINWRAFESAEFSAILDQELSININGAELNKLQTIIEPRWDIDFSDNVRVKTVARIRLDTEGDLGFPGGNDHVDIEVREVYADMQWLGAYWRLGKQQVVWGQADGLRVLDVVNPFDFREFILGEFEDRRIPLWTVNVEIPLNDIWMAQLLWIPDQNYDEFPEKYDVFSMSSPLLVPEIPAGMEGVIESTELPNRIIEDSDIGLRLSAFVGGWDVSINYLYHYQDQAVLFQSVDRTRVTISPSYERSHLIGGSFSNVISSFTFRGEVGYSTDRFFLVNDRADSDGVINSGELSYLLGIDYQGWRDWFVSSQIFQSVVTDSRAGLVREKIETTATFLARRWFMNETVKAEALVINSVNQGDGVLKVAIEYEWKSDVRLKLEADVFFGSSNGLYGQFDKSDRVLLGIEISF